MSAKSKQDIDWENTTVMVTGVVGTVGKTLADRLLRLGVNQIIGFDHSESGMYVLGQRYKQDSRFTLILGDVRDYNALSTAMQGVDLVFHGAALKHVELGEQRPGEIVQTNVIGVQNVIDAARAASVKRVVFMSSDKAVNPTNTMGASKLMGEKLISAANENRVDETVFFSTRFGNVLGSSGSVVPGFIDCLRRKVPLTLTDERMTRFVMSVDQAVTLLIEAVFHAEGGEIFVTKMPVMRIVDLMHVIIDIYCSQTRQNPQEVEFHTVGKRAGEKMYEELMSSEEALQAIETDEFFVLYPVTCSPGYPIAFTPNIRDYRSDHETAMDKKAIRDYLLDHRIFDHEALAYPPFLSASNTEAA